MKTIATLTATALAAATMLTAAPAAAQSYVVVIGEMPKREVRERAASDLATRIDAAVEQACEKPFIRDLAAWKLYAECTAAARAEIDAQLAEVAKGAPVTFAMR